MPRLEYVVGSQGERILSKLMCQLQAIMEMMTTEALSGDVYVNPECAPSPFHTLYIHITLTPLLPTSPPAPDMKALRQGIPSDCVDVCIHSGLLNCLYLPPRPCTSGKH